MDFEGIKLEKIQYNDIEGIEEIYVEAFPKSERKPFSVILSHNASGRGSLLKITVDGKVRGFFFTFFYRDLAMVDYFAIHKDFRNAGIGKAALDLLRREYCDKRIFLEIEAPESGEVAARRLGFYERCGFYRIGTYVNLFSVDMELLALGSFDVDFDTYFALYVSMLGKERAGMHVKERKLQK